MASTEQAPVWFGPVSRLMGEDDSRVLAQLPKGIYPDPEPACATCPGKDWYVTAKEVRCYCTPRGVVSWVSNEAPVMACDTRERLIDDAEARARIAKTG
ncbi:hypothetical protein [Sphingomonas bacterium]|uniref:hypothetical protein n=1 Tax=Sphingomonas bacterium TaxID=1895847 RepID=UPI001576DFC7|nr:hypothetical protein [Sphingomonas bacterium]